jgi:predicted DNA-binding transcriptional regulator AlpA
MGVKGRIQQARTEQQADTLLSARQVAQRFGGISLVSIWRWRQDPAIAFPPPDATIRGRNFWRLSTIEAAMARLTKARDVA